LANTLLTPTIITKEALRVLENNLVAAKYVNREPEVIGELTGPRKIGDSITVRKPNRFTVRSGVTYSAQDVTETSAIVQLATQIGVDFEFGAKELTLTIDQFSKRYLIPAMATLANKIDLDILAQYAVIANQVGTPATTPATFAAILDVAKKLDICSVPRDELRQLVVDANANAALADALKGLFNPGSQISETIKKGMIASQLGGFNGVYMDQNIPIHTVGPLGGTPVVSGASQGILVGYADYTDLLTSGWTAAAAVRLNRGDVITLALVYGVNPQSRQSTGVLQQFACSSITEGNVSSDGSGVATIRIRPAIIAGGPYQNVTVRPAASAAVTVTGTAATAYPINLGFHRDAMCLVSVPFEMPKGVDFAAQETYKGITMSIVRWFDGTNHKFPCRVDVLYGVKVLYPELACRLIG